MELCAPDNVWTKKIQSCQSYFQNNCSVTCKQYEWSAWIAHNVVVLCLLNLPRWSSVLPMYQAFDSSFALGRRKRNQYGGASEMVSQTNGRSNFWREKGESAMLTKFARKWMHAHANSWLQRGGQPKGTDQTPDCKGIAFRQLYRFRRGIWCLVFN